MKTSEKLKKQYIAAAFIEKLQEKADEYNGTVLTLRPIYSGNGNDMRADGYGISIKNTECVTRCGTTKYVPQTFSIQLDQKFMKEFLELLTKHSV